MAGTAYLHGVPFLRVDRCADENRRSTFRSRTVASAGCWIQRFWTEHASRTGVGAQPFVNKQIFVFLGYDTRNPAERYW